MYLVYPEGSWSQFVPQGTHFGICSESQIAYPVAQYYVGVWKWKWWMESATIGKRLVTCGGRTSQICRGVFPTAVQVRTEQPGVQDSEEVHRTCLLHPQRLKQDIRLVLVQVAIRGYQQAGGPINQVNLFFTVLQAERGPRSRLQQMHCLVRVCFLFHR